MAVKGSRRWMPTRNADICTVVSLPGIALPQVESPYLLLLKMGRESGYIYYR